MGYTMQLAVVSGYSSMKNCATSFPIEHNKSTQWTQIRTVYETTSVTRPRTKQDD